MVSALRHGVIKERIKLSGWLRKELVTLEMKRILHEIERSRAQMEQRYVETGNLHDSNIMLVSRYIDGLVNRYQQLSSGRTDKR